jgi:hypothetical protein
MKDLVSISQGKGAASTSFSSTVAVRVRPFNTQDFHQENIQSKSVVGVSKSKIKRAPSTIKLTNPKFSKTRTRTAENIGDDDENNGEAEVSGCTSSARRYNKPDDQPVVDLQFQHIFQKETQEEISDDFIPNMVHSFLKGVNCCIISAGGPGSGKGYTLFGKEGPFAMPVPLRKVEPEKAADYGLFPRFYECLFEWLSKSQFDKAQLTEVVVEAFEVKNEDILDIQVDAESSMWYSKSDGTSIRHQEGNFKPQGLQKQVVSTLADMVQLHNMCTQNSSGIGHVVYLVTLKREVRTDHSDYYSNGWADAALVS